MVLLQIKACIFRVNYTSNKKFFDQIESLSNEEIAFQAIHQFVGDEIPEVALRQIIKRLVF